MAKMSAAAFTAKAVEIAKNYKTLYVMGCFGAPMNAKNKTRYTQNNAYNKQPARTAMINAASSDTFGFDCVCLIKGILWGWSGDLTKVYGGATYASNGVPDISADQMIRKCEGGGSTNFAGIVPGEMLWKEGHAGIYIGDGLAVECTPAWANKVQITAVGNLGTVQGYNARQWTKHGLLPWVDYSKPEPVPEPVPEPEPVPDEPSPEEALGPYIYRIGDIPHASVAREMRVLLDCGAVNGGTSYEVDPDDINLPYAVVRALVIMKRYVDMKAAEEER